ncbi:FliH/SctL family protein [Pelagerythrobacter sp.]|uniref:FliH/SctL family protein n=1 Tax=Pelagerythrobacter sp. TaxID=2800702 RepID=UPI0035B0CFA8
MSSAGAARIVLPLERLRGGGGFARDPRFSAHCAQPAAERSEQPAHDPVAEAYRRGLAEGRAEAEAQAARREAERDGQRAAIELAFARFDAGSAADLRERLRLTVLALCERTVMPLAIDAEGLAARIDLATAMLQRAQDERRVLLNPEDLALVEGRVPADVVLVADASIERGALRIETEDGGIEDGPAQWRRILEEAFREC